MATSGFTDFSEYATGSKPSDWTVTNSGDADVWKVADDAGATGGKVLHHETGSSQTSIGWDVSDDGETLQECVVRLKLTAFGSPSQVAGPTVRDDDSGNPGLVAVRLDDIANGVFVFEGVTSLGFAAITIDAGTWYWVRFRVEGTVWKVKVWAGSADSEPGAWTKEGDDPIDVTSGMMGVVATWFKVMDVDVFGFGTGGETAPTAHVWVQDTEPAGSWVQD